MGSLRDLRDTNINVHLLLTKSNQSEIYVYDTLKSKCKATMESIVTVNNVKSFNNMLDLVSTYSFLSDKWLFVIEFGKVKKNLKKVKGIFSTDTAEFLIKVKDYKEFLEAKELVSNANDMYLAYMGYYDVEFLLRDYEISPNMISFVAKSYANDVDEIFNLVAELKNGLVLENRKQVLEICGVSSGSLNNFIFLLLRETKDSRRVIKSRMSVGLELSDSYGFSKMRNFMLSCIKDILDIKLLYLRGIIYDKIIDLPDTKVFDSKAEEYTPVYDIKKLGRYNYCLETIKALPLDRIIKLYLGLKEQNSWHSSRDLMYFVYHWYEEVV